jgi:hypothetical protein
MRVGLISRQIVGRATRAAKTSDLVLQALLAAVWKPKPEPGVMIHVDQGRQFTSDDWQSFLKAHHMVSSMNRRTSTQPVHEVGAHCIGQYPICIALAQVSRTREPVRFFVGEAV